MSDALDQAIYRAQQAHPAQSWDTGMMSGLRADQGIVSAFDGKLQNLISAAQQQGISHDINQDAINAWNNGKKAGQFVGQEAKDAWNDVFHLQNLNGPMETDMSKLGNMFKLGMDVMDTGAKDTSTMDNQYNSFMNAMKLQNLNGPMATDMAKMGNMFKLGMDVLDTGAKDTSTMDNQYNSFMNAMKLQNLNGPMATDMAKMGNMFKLGMDVMNTGAKDTSTMDSQYNSFMNAIKLQNLAAAAPAQAQTTPGQGIKELGVAFGMFGDMIKGEVGLAKDL